MAVASCCGVKLLEIRKGIAKFDQNPAFPG